MVGKYPNGKGKPGRKPKFKPEISRIKLNPEQTVLACNCYYERRGPAGYVRRGYYYMSGSGMGSYRVRVGGIMACVMWTRQTRPAVYVHLNSQIS